MNLSSMPTARHHAATAVFDGNIHVIGGRLSGSLVNLNVNEKYDTVLDHWTADLEPMTSKRSGIAATAVNGSIYVLGENKIRERLIIMNVMNLLLIPGVKNFLCQPLDME
jgi:hypothetical protein